MKRFLNADSLFIAGDEVTGSNMYAYCNGNPVMYSDPSGMLPDDFDDFFTGVIVLEGVAQLILKALPEELRPIAKDMLNAFVKVVFDATGLLQGSGKAFLEGAKDLFEAINSLGDLKSILQGDEKNHAEARWYGFDVYLSHKTVVNLKVFLGAVTGGAGLVAGLTAMAVSGLNPFTAIAAILTAAPGIMLAMIDAADTDGKGVIVSVHLLAYNPTMPFGIITPGLGYWVKSQ